MKTMTAPLALAASLCLAPAAFAQVTVGGQEVSQADLVSVTEHCNTLAAGSAVESSGNLGNPENANSVEVTASQTDLSDPAAEATTGNEGNPENDIPDDPAASSTAGRTVDDTSGVSGNQENEVSLDGSVNLQAITLADCQAAGL